MLTTQELQELKQRLDQVICPVCTEVRPDGTCGLSELEQCPIWIHLPRLVEIVTSFQSDRMDGYVQKVREEICTNCRSALFPRGECDFRQEGHCALDAFLLVIVETIEDFLAEKTARSVING